MIFDIINYLIIGAYIVSLFLTSNEGGSILRGDKTGLFAIFAMVLASWFCLVGFVYCSYKLIMPIINLFK